MMFLIALALPPLAMFMVGKPVQALICLALQVTLIGWLPASLWALFVVNAAQADKRNERLLKSMGKDS